ncbi:MAG TPA: DUF6799 domain-containing protein [Anaerolineales bacterium]
MKEDHIIMREGKVILLRNGGEMPVEEEMTMADGTRIMPNGQVLMPDGTTRMMREGETMTIDRMQTDSAEDVTDGQFKEAMEDEELRDDMH